LLYGVVNGQIESWTIGGTFDRDAGDDETCYDLLLEPEFTTEYLIRFERGKYAAFAYDNEEAAEHFAKQYPGSTVVAIKVEVEVD
jgi:hypothetical protein